jgi:serine/threonine protein kinase
LVRVYDIMEDSKRIYVISEFLKGTELQKRVIAQNTLFEEKNALLITRKIADALLAYLEVGLIYLDLRCEKILFINESLNSLDIKLVDNGTSVPYLPGHNLNLDQ